jgi:hypothetical protein
MRKILTTALLGLALTICFYGSMAALINRVSISNKRIACWINPQFQRIGGQEWRLVNDWPKYDPYDIVVYGSSHAYRGYDPDFFEKKGYEMFAAGSGFQNSEATYYLQSYEFPAPIGSLAIIDLFDQTYEGEGYGSFQRIIQNAGNDATAWSILKNNPDLRIFNSWMCRMMSKGMPVETPDEEGYLRNGYCPKTDSLKKEPAAIKTTHLEFNPIFGQYLRALVQKLQNNQTKVILVSHPQPRTHSFKVYHDTFRKFIDPYINDLNVLYFDYNSDHALETFVHFADANHLNTAGVAAFNELLFTDLTNNGIIPVR